MKRRVIGIVVFVLVIAGCAGKPPEPKQVPLEIAGTDQLNPRENGEPQNVDVLIFQLAATDAFSTAGLLSLYPQPSKPQAVLGGDLLGLARYQVSPGQMINVDLEVEADARYVGVVVAFEQFHRANWRDVVQLRDETITDKVLFRNKKLKVTIASLSVSVTRGK